MTSSVRLFIYMVAFAGILLGLGCNNTVEFDGATALDPVAAKKAAYDSWDGETETGVAAMLLCDGVESRDPVGQYQAGHEFHVGDSPYVWVALQTAKSFEAPQDVVITLTSPDGDQRLSVKYAVDSSSPWFRVTQTRRLAYEGENAWTVKFGGNTARLNFTVVR